jgi:hypothetical protein
MTALEQIARVKRRLSLTGVTYDALLSDMVADAESMILAYTGQDVMPDALNGAWTDIAVMLYNRTGLEGKASHSEGGVSISVDTLPAALKGQLDNWRVCRVVNMLS